MPPRCQRWRCNDCSKDTGLSIDRRGRVGSKSIATSSTGKIGVRGCSFMGRGETSPGNDAAFLEHRVYTLFGKLAAPNLLDAQIVADSAKALGVDSGKRHVERHHAHRARLPMGRWRNVGGSLRPGLCVRRIEVKLYAARIGTGPTRRYAPNLLDARSRSTSMPIALGVRPFGYGRQEGPVPPRPLAST